MVYDIEQINVTILSEVRIERQAEHSVIVIASDFFANVQNWRGELNVIFDDPDPPKTVPRVD